MEHIGIDNEWGISVYQLVVAEDKCMGKDLIPEIKDEVARLLDQ